MGIDTGGGSDNEVGIGHSLSRKLHNRAEAFNALVETHGLHHAAREVLARYCIGVDTGFQGEGTQEVLHNCGSLVISTHPRMYETGVVVSALPPRGDLRAASNSMFSQFGEALSRYLLPFESVNEKGSGIIGSMGQRIGFRIGEESRVEALQRNIEMTTAAAKHVADGGQVLWFPDGRNWHSGRWLDGLGYMIQDVGQMMEMFSNDEPDRFVVLAHVGWPRLNIPRNDGQRFTISVVFGPAISVRDILVRQEIRGIEDRKVKAKKIVALLKAIYERT